MKVMAVIPARGGSKGIPRKNILHVAGKPLLAWSIEAAFASRHVQRVVVSTDDLEIAAVAKKYNAEVVCRPAEISGDNASSESALLHVLDTLLATDCYEPDIIVFLQCTSPLTAVEDIDGTIEKLLTEKADSAFTAATFHYFLWREGGDGNAIEVNHDIRVRLMRQQRQQDFIETGAVYVMKAAGFRAAGHRFFGKTVLYAIPESRCWEIDEPFDLVVAESLMRKELKRRKTALLPSRIEALALDFDGVFTDNRVLVFEDGREAIWCSRSDGLGLAELRRLGLPIVVISTEKNSVVAARCQKLSIECVHGVDDKLSVLKQWAAKSEIDLRKIVYVGNDVNDLTCMQEVGCPVVVSDSHPAVLKFGKIVLTSRGGEGALREICDLIIKRRKE
jgi:N-acylneuraminate cytidylyltransferase